MINEELLEKLAEEDAKRVWLHNVSPEEDCPEADGHIAGFIEGYKYAKSEKQPENDLGSIIRQQRGKVPQHELCKKMNTTQAYLSQIENNQRLPSVSWLNAFAEATDTILQITFKSK